MITHAHSDHARRGSREYWCAPTSVGLLRARLGRTIEVHPLAYGKKLRFGEVEISLHPAGHILGSAQVRVQRGEEVWVATGDYKRDPDPSCEPFEVVPCQTLITEATFGTPKYVWDRARHAGAEILEWWQANALGGRNSVLFGYSLGKAQRILAELAPHAERKIIIHRTMTELTECYRREGRALAPTRCLDEIEGSIRGELLLIPPQALDDALVLRLGDHETAFASGWMQDQKPGAPFRGGKGYDRGFVLSDHADWSDLNRTIEESGARRVFVQHRGMGALVRHLRSRGLEAYPAEYLAPERFQKIAPANLELFG